MTNHLLRLGCFALLIGGLHGLAQRAIRDRGDQVALSLATVEPLLPGAKEVVQTSEAGLWEVRGADGQAMALVCMTAPTADDVVGYAGPNNVLIVMDQQGRVQQTHWLSWLDTHDHVERVRANEQFWEQFQGRGLSEPTTGRVDGVSGATLTSLAIAEAIDLRLSGKRPSLRFPATLTLEEVQSLYPEAAQFSDDSRRASFTEVRASDGRKLGAVVRTGPLVESQVGYQGPTELLLAIDAEDRLTKVKLRSSFDNEPYVKYTRMEASFWSRFIGRTLTEISQMDWEAEGIEGVSGATMTSMATAETVRAAARRLLEEASKLDRNQVAPRAWNWSLGEVSTAVLAVLLMPWSLSRLRGHRRWRIAWQVFTLVVVVGISGNLISMALLSGWTRSGMPVTFAPGLALLVAVSLVMSAVRGRNVYCDHVCPHGVVQQWMARWLRRRPPSEQTAPLVQLQPGLPRRSGWWRTQALRALRLSALSILLASMSWVIWTVPQQLTFFEPFDVYAWRVGWSVSLAVWVGSLLLAAKEPMGYCRFACPTGMLLEGIRRKRTGRTWQWADMLLLTLTLTVWLYSMSR